MKQVARTKTWARVKEMCRMRRRRRIAQSIGHKARVPEMLGCYPPRSVLTLHINSAVCCFLDSCLLTEFLLSRRQELRKIIIPGMEQSSAAFLRPSSEPLETEALGHVIH